MFECVQNEGPQWSFISNKGPLWVFKNPHGYQPLSISIYLFYNFFISLISLKSTIYCFKHDPWGDHCLGCPGNHKAYLSNAARDGICDIFKHILSITKMIHSGTQMEKEVGNIVPSLPALKPFDLSIRLNHLLILTQGAWQIPFGRIGFDIRRGVHTLQQTCPNRSFPRGCFFQ